MKQALVQARKAGIASAMASRASIKDEELVSKMLIVHMVLKYEPRMTF